MINILPLGSTSWSSTIPNGASSQEFSGGLVPEPSYTAAIGGISNSDNNIEWSKVMLPSLQVQSPARVGMSAGVRALQTS